MIVEPLARFPDHGYRIRLTGALRLFFSGGWRLAVLADGHEAYGRRRARVRQYSNRKLTASRKP
jgi:hypothetical protein